MGVTGGSGGAHGTQGNGRNARGLCHEKALGVLLAALLSVHPLGVRYDTLTFGYKQHATTREHSTAALRRQRVRAWLPPEGSEGLSSRAQHC